MMGRQRFTALTSRQIHAELLRAEREAALGENYPSPIVSVAKRRRVRPVRTALLAALGLGAGWALAVGVVELSRTIGPIWTTVVLGVVAFNGLFVWALARTPAEADGIERGMR